MLVFRCECEHVLGVEDESSKGGAGKCPACGRIVRVPDVLVNAHGRLRLMGTPARATPSGAYRQIKDTKPDSVKVGPLPATDLIKNQSAAKVVPKDEASTMIDTRGIAGIINPKNGPAASKKTESPVRKSEPEVHASAPMNAEERAPAQVGALTAFGLPAQMDDADLPTESEIPAAAPVEMPVQTPPPAKSGKKNVKSGRSLAKGANDPAAAVETRIDRGLAGVANAAASSKRRKVETAPAAAPARKSPLIFVIIGVVALIAIAGVLYALGVFGGAEKPTETPKDSGNKPTVVNKVVDEKTDEKKAQETPPAKTDTKTEGAGETKADTKTEAKAPETEKAPAPADTKTEEKKPEVKIDGDKAN